MKRVYIITGAAGHLGRNIVKKLAAGGAAIRALVLPGEDVAALEKAGAQVFVGDVRDKESLRPLFAGLQGRQVVVIHTAAIIDITSQVSPLAQEVNVGGTKNMADLALEYGVWRFVHVSSVHAIPEAAGGRLITETKDFSQDSVEGGYAKTKAEASRYIMDAVQAKGLPAIVLHPSGIVGPMEHTGGYNNIVAAVKGYLEGKIPMCPRGGYDLVDVRDVANACIAAVDHGRVGETYILSGKHYEFSQIFAMLRHMTGKKGNCPQVPLFLARMAAPILERHALRKKEHPLITRYSLNTLGSNDNFSHEKASRELGFWPRDIYESLHDTVQSLALKSREKKARRIPAKRRRLRAKA